MINLKIYYKNGEDVCSESIATASVDLCSKEDCCTPCTGERTLDVSIPVGACYEVVTFNGVNHIKFPINILAKCGTAPIDFSEITNLIVLWQGKEFSGQVVLENGVYKVLLGVNEVTSPSCAQGFAIKGTRDECGTNTTYQSAFIPYCQVGPCVTDPCVTCTSTELSVALDTSELCFIPNDTEGKEYAPLNPYVMCGTTAIYNADIEIKIKQNTAGCNLELVQIGTQYYLKKDLGCQTAFSGIVELEFCINKC